ncbi:MFS transporter [Luteococcus peritonei]|uniref:MFS transporter n=1 Tax=Luteococcus peritonei TaxID=88874 RepID=A0ABW4RT74_9ACTN
MAQESIYRRLFWPVFAPSILFGIAGGATVPVQVVAAMHLGASASLAALVVALVAAVGLATTVQAGRLIDRLGDRRAMLLATVAAAVTELGSIAALVWGGRGALELFIATSLLRAPALNVWGLARQAFTAERVAVHEVGRAMTGLGGTMRIGALIGPLLGGLLLMRLPLWSVYLLSVLCAVLALVILYIPSLGGRLESGAAVSSGAPTTQTGDDGEPLRVDWTRVVLAGIAIIALQLARTAQPVIVQLWGVHLGLDESRISLLIAIGAAVEIVLMFPGGYLKDRLGRSVILVACLGLYGLGYLLVVPLTHWWGVAGVVVAVVVMAVGNGLGAGVNMTIGADLSPAEGRGRFLGIWALFSGAGALSGPLLISALVRVAVVQTAVLAVGGLTVAGAAWVLCLAPRLALPRGIGREKTD